MAFGMLGINSYLLLLNYSTQAVPTQGKYSRSPVANREAYFQRTFERLYYEHAPALFQYGAKFSVPTAQVEDCVQELFADLWEKKQLESIRSVRPYLLGALRRKLLRSHYQSREEGLTSQDLFTLSERLTVPDDTTGTSEETVGQLRAALAKLTPKQQEVLYLRFYNQLSFREISVIMSVQTRTVYKLCHRSVDTLRRYLSKVPPVVYLLFVMLFD